MTEKFPVTRYVVRFDRIGRKHDVADLVVTATDADDLAAQVYRYARPKLVSRDIDVSIDLDKGAGVILCGFHVGGHFEFREQASPEKQETPS